MPLKNQQLYKVTLPEYIRTIEPLQELHKTHVVKIKGKPLSW